MKKLLLLALVTLSTLFSACLFEDDEDEWDAAKVCPEAGTNAYGMPNRGEFTDARDGRVYKYTTIGDQVWMAENLKFELPYPYSLCYGMEVCKEEWWEDTTCTRDTTHLAEIAQRMQSTCTDNDCIATEWCEKVGRYYTLYEDGADKGLLNRALIDTICPKGWHIPTKDEFEILMKTVEYEQGRIMSSDSTLFIYAQDKFPGNDVCGFAALFAGWFSFSDFREYFHYGKFASSTSRNSGYAYALWLGFNSKVYIEDASPKTSVRCLKD